MFWYCFLIFIAVYFTAQSIFMFLATLARIIAMKEAFVDISITTVESMTADYYSRMLWLKDDEEEAGGKHTGMGSGNIDISGIGNAVAAGVQKVAQWTGIGQEEAN